MKTRVLGLWIFWLITWPNLARAQASVPAPEFGPEQSFEAAVLDYEAGRYAEAELGFRRLLEDGHVDANVLFNMGNAAHRQGRFAVAVYAQEWARILAPGDEAIEQNLTMARDRLVMDELSDGLSPTVQKIQTFLRGLPLALLQALCLALWCLGWGLLLVRLIGKERAAVCTWPGVGLLLASLVVAAPLGFRLREEAGPPRGVLVAAEVEVKSGPGEDYATLFSLHAGTLLQLDEQRGDWNRIRVPHSKTSGWIPSEGLALFGQINTLAVARD